MGDFVQMHERTHMHARTHECTQNFEDTFMVIIEKV